MELVVLFLIVFVSYALSIPMDTQFDGGGDGSCTQYYYALFDGAICGVVLFTGMEEGEVTVQTSGKGICGLPSNGGPFPYQSITPLFMISLYVGQRLTCSFHGLCWK